MHLYDNTSIIKKYIKYKPIYFISSRQLYFCCLKYINFCLNNLKIYIVIKIVIID